MGDNRFDPPYDRVQAAADRAKAISAMYDAEVILALGGAARAGDTYLANVLTTEVLNRHRRLAAWFAAVAYGAAAFIFPRIVLTFVLADPRLDVSEAWRVLLTVVLLVASGTVAAAMYWRARRLGSSAGV